MASIFRPQLRLGAPFEHREESSATENDVFDVATASTRCCTQTIGPPREASSAATRSRKTTDDAGRPARHEAEEPALRQYGTASQ